MRLQPVDWNQDSICNISGLVWRIGTSDQCLSTNTSQPVTPHDEISAVRLTTMQSHLGRKIEFDMCDLAIDVDLHAQFQRPLEHCPVEIRTMYMPIRMAIFVDALGDQIDLTQNSAISVCAKHKALRIDTIFRELIRDAPSLQQSRRVGGDLDPCAHLTSISPPAMGIYLGKFGRSFKDRDVVSYKGDLNCRRKSAKTSAFGSEL